MKKLRRNFLLVIVLLLFLSVQTESGENLVAHNEEGSVKGSDNTEVTAKAQGTKSDDGECPCINPDGNNENSKLENPEQVPSNSDGKAQISKLEETKESQQAAGSKQTNENANECNQQSGNQAAKSEELKVEDSNNLPVAVDDSKQQKNKEDDKNQKIDLNDVNSQKEDYDHAAKSRKRETNSDSTSFVLGLPRDASYFFDDLEPFINNSSDIGRIGRAAPSRDKNEKSRLNSKGKEIMEDDVDEDEEEEKNGDDEKQDEDDYDDDEDADSDCKPTTSCPTTPNCPTTPKCPTTRCPTTTTPCPPPTTKCTTKRQCPTTCKTTPECTTKCPRVCGRGGNKMQLGARQTTDAVVNWDADKKRINHKKRKVHSKVASPTK